MEGRTSEDRTVPRRGRSARRRWRRLAAWQQVALVLLAGALTFTLLVALRREPEQREPPRQIPVVTTAPARIESGPILVRGSGTVRPSAEVTLAPQVGGRVAWVSPSFVSGGRVVAGEPLFRIEAADYENAVAAAEADVAGRRVDVLQAEEEVQIAREEYARLAAREGLDPEGASPLVLREPQLQAARAALGSAEARAEDARLALERTRVRAPFDGVVREESVDIGQYVGAGQSVGRMYATGSVEIVVPLSDDRAALIGGLWTARAGDAGTRIPATVRAEYGGRTFVWDAYVDRAEAALDDRTRTVNVVLGVPDPFAPTEGSPERPPLLLGTYAIVDIEGASFDRYAVIPSDGLRDGGVVWVLASDSMLVMTPVRLIQEVEDEAFVLGDLAEGTPVIVSGLPFVTDGMTVRATRALETTFGAGDDETPAEGSR